VCCACQLLTPPPSHTHIPLSARPLPDLQHLVELEKGASAELQERLRELQRKLAEAEAEARSSSAAARPARLERDIEELDLVDLGCGEPRAQAGKMDKMDKMGKMSKRLHAQPGLGDENRGVNVPQQYNALYGDDGF